MLDQDNWDILPMMDDLFSVKEGRHVFLHFKWRRPAASCRVRMRLTTNLTIILRTYHLNARMPMAVMVNLTGGFSQVNHNKWKNRKLISSIKEFQRKTEPGNFRLPFLRSAESVFKERFSSQQFNSSPPSNIVSNPVPSVQNSLFASPK